MKKKYGILFLTIITIIIVACRNSGGTFQAPSKTEPGFLELSRNACIFDNSSVPNKISLYESTDAEQNQVSAIMKFAGLPQNFKLYRGNINTALATMVNNQQLLIYNKELFASDKIDNTYWSTLFIIAHEIGHHLAYNLSDTNNVLQAELDADKFAGAILYRMGADSNQVLMALNSDIVADAKKSPEKNTRIETVKNSWRKAFELRYQSVIPPPIDDILSVKKFTPENLIYNSMTKYMFQSELESEDDSTKAMMQRFISTPVSKNLSGIIINIQDLTNKDAGDDNIVKITELKLTVLITKIDTTYRNEDENGKPIIANQQYEFKVWYEPVLSTDKTKDLFRFFVIGRRFTFDLINLDYNQMGGMPLNIYSAKALYNSY